MDFYTQLEVFFLQIRFSKVKSYVNVVRRNHALHLITYKIREEITGHIMYDIERYAFENEDRQRKSQIFSSFFDIVHSISTQPFDRTR